MTSSMMTVRLTLIVPGSEDQVHQDSAQRKHGKEKEGMRHYSAPRKEISEPANTEIQRDSATD